MKMKTAIFILILVFVVAVKTTFAFEEQETHRKITEKATGFSNAEKYIINNLGFCEGLKTVFPVDSTNTIIYWLMEGSKLEDSVVCRRANHFHNPLLPWEQSGMGDDPLWAESGCTFWTRYSAVTWGTGYLSPSPGGGKQAFTQWPDILALT